MLNLKNIEIKVGKRLLFKSSEICLTNGLIAVVGRNGSGKSTLFKSILKSHSIDKGQILLFDKDLVEYSSAEMSQLIAVVYTKSEVFGDHTVKDILLLGRIPYQGFFGKNTALDLKIIEEVAKKMNIIEFLDRQFAYLSDGEKQLVMIARAFVQETPIILLDEPSAFLDVVNRLQLVQILKDLAKTENKLILYSTHHLDQLEVNCEGVLLIHEEKMELLTDKNKFQSSIKAAFKL